MDFLIVILNTLQKFTWIPCLVLAFLLSVVLLAPSDWYAYIHTDAPDSASRLHYLLGFIVSLAIGLSKPAEYIGTSMMTVVKSKRRDRRDVERLRKKLASLTDEERSALRHFVWEGHLYIEQTEISFTLHRYRIMASKGLLEMFEQIDGGMWHYWFHLHTNLKSFLQANPELLLNPSDNPATFVFNHDGTLAERQDAK